MAVIASSNHKYIKVTRKPKVAIIATGNEIVRAGEASDDFQIVGYAIYSLMGIMAKMLGVEIITKYDEAICEIDLDENAQREDYLLAFCKVIDGNLFVTSL